MEYDTVISGSIGSGAVGSVHIADGGISSGNIGSGQVSQFHIASGAITSGHLSVAGTPDGSKFLRDDFSWAAAGGGLTSGAVQSGYIASGAVQGFFGSTRHIASGTVGADDLGSGAVVAGAIGSGAVQSGNIASGQISNNHFASGSEIPFARGVQFVDLPAAQLLSGDRGYWVTLVSGNMVDFASGYPVPQNVFGVV